MRRGARPRPVALVARRQRRQTDRHSDNCYLIRHGKDWLLWDTGYNDDYAGKPDGTKSGDSVVFRKQSLAEELAALHLKPADIRYVAISHMHPDHTGNVDAFSRQSTIVLGQRVRIRCRCKRCRSRRSTPDHTVLTLRRRLDEVFRRTAALHPTLSVSRLINRRHAIAAL